MLSGKVEVWSENDPDKTRVVYHGPIAEPMKVMSGLRSVQPNPFGRKYWVSGDITTDGLRPVRGLKCRITIEV